MKSLRHDQELRSGGVPHTGRDPESGQSLIIVAFFLMLVSVGFLALAIDAGMLFQKRRMAQSAADAAAMAAAVESAAGATDEQTVADAVATLNGLDTSAARNPAKVKLTNPSTGDFTGTSYWQATVSQPFATQFLGAFTKSLATVTVAATGTAGGGNSSPTCVCLTGSSSSDTDLQMSNGSQIQAPACTVIDNSPGTQAIIMDASTLNALSLGTVSKTWNNSTNIYGGSTITSTTKIVQGMATGCSSTMPTPPSYSVAGCLSDPGAANGNVTVGPASAGGTICYNNLTMGNNGGITTLRPGIYVIRGYLTFNYGSSNLSNKGGNGVFFYVTNGGSVTIQNGANVNLVAGGMTEADGHTVAPSTGAYDGILIYQDSSDSVGMTISGGSGTTINGSLYAPASAITMNNGSGTTVNAGVVAAKLNMSGGATLAATTLSNTTGLVTANPKLVQ